ncbi:MAG: hypothetical protein SOY59_02140 [Ligilactobacillus agilis]|nr:hypothetical protein [Ligilactobacillus agilis]
MSPVTTRNYLWTTFWTTIFSRRLLNLYCNWALLLNKDTREELQRKKREQEQEMKKADQRLKELKNQLRRERRQHEKTLTKVIRAVERLYGEDIPENVTPKQLTGIVNTVNSRLTVEERETPLKNVFEKDNEQEGDN